MGLEANEYHQSISVIRGARAHSCNSMKHIAKQIHSHLANVKKAVIVPHQNPDADALGSAAALLEYLIKLGIPAQVFCPLPVVKQFNFLLDNKFVINDPKTFFDGDAQTVVVLDSGDLRYAGVDQHLRNHPATIINIDHHASNQNFGALNLVSPACSSTCEILADYFRFNNVAVSNKMATALLAGILADTDNFTNAATSAEALLVSSRLLIAGADISLINKNVVKNKTVDGLRLWGKIFSRLEKIILPGNVHTLNVNGDIKLTYTYLTQDDILEHQITDSDTNGLANFLNNLDNTDIALILKETPEQKIKGSLRTTKDNLDMTVLAKKLGGGGHKKAAGFTTAGTLDEVLNKILTA